MNTDTNTIAGQAVSRFLVSDLVAIRQAAQHPDYVMNEEGVRVATSAVRKAFRRQLMPAKGEVFAAAVEFVTA